MAHAATYADFPRDSALTRSARWLAQSFNAIAQANPRLRRVRWLQERSDTELAALNIPRDQIVHHVFRDTYYR